MAVDLGKTVAASVSMRCPPEPGEPLPRLLPQIGRYTILGTLGRGGMGLVYKGYDAELDRRVAIKLFHRNPESVGDSHAREIHARAIREAQALAKLSHPNVVAVHEVGSFEGQVFIVMEYVLGETLREWLARRPPYARMLEVFVQIAQGLAAAHRAGIIHRDLKPENVVVRSDGHAQVLDFGLARTAEVIEAEHDITGHSHPRARQDSNQHVTLTSPGDLIGTPAYMAPEQLLRERACERSDQYSFCVCLYEAIHGVRPFVANTVDGLRLAVLKGELREVEQPHYPAPSYLRAALLRGLSFDRAGRFASMDALLEVLVDGKRRRHERHLLLGGLGLAATLMAAGGAHWVAGARAQAGCEADSHRAAALWPASRQHQTRERMLATGLDFAAASFDRLAPEVERFVAQWAATSERVCRYHAVERSWDAELTARANECLAEAEWALMGLVSVLAEAGPAAVQRAAHATGGLPQLEPCLRPELLRQRSPRAGHLGERARSAVLLAAIGRARSLLVTGQYGDVEVLTAQLRGAARGAGEGRLIAEIQLIEGLALAARDELARAEAALHAAATAAATAGDTGLLVDALAAQAHVGGALAGHHEEGLRRGELALALAGQLGAGGRLRTSQALRSLAGVHLARGELALAEEQIREAVGLMEAELGPEHPDLIDGVADLARVLVQRDQAAEALQLATRVLASRRSTRGDEHPATLAALESVAEIHAELAQYAEAATSYRAALALREAAPGPGHLDVARVLDSLARVERERGALATAEDLLRRSLAIRSKAQGEAPVDLASSLHDLGVTLTRSARASEALPLLERALDLRERSLGSEHADVAETLAELAVAELALGRGEVARARLERALKIVESRATRARGVASIRFELGRALWAERPDPRALDLVRAASLDAPHDPKIGEWLDQHARARPGP